MNNLNNIKKSKKFRAIINIFIPGIIFILILSLAFFMGGCKKKAPVVPETVSQAETTSEQTTATTAQQAESATESIEEIPQEVTALIDKADSYYSGGDFGLARSTYRKAEIAVNDSDLSDDTKKELIDSFYPKYEKAKEIVEAASMHHANAMQLIYETRYEEAKTELETALALYPKYAEAQEAYDNLKTLMGLQ